MQAAEFVQDGDAVALFNFRSDRMVQISKAFEYEDFNAFDRKRFPKVTACCCGMMLILIQTGSETSKGFGHVSLEDRDVSVGVCSFTWAFDRLSYQHGSPPLDEAKLCAVGHARKAA